MDIKLVVRLLLEIDLLLYTRCCLKPVGLAVISSVACATGSALCCVSCVTACVSVSVFVCVCEKEEGHLS